MTFYDGLRSVRKRVRLTCRSLAMAWPALLSLLIMFYPAQFSQAVTISSTSVSNNSAPNQTYGGTGIARSFQTANVLGSVVNNPGGATLSNHFMFNNTLRVVQPEGPNAALTQGRRAAYQLDFTVDDPTNVGYELIVETNYRGYVSARSHNGVTATASAGHLSGYIDTDTTDALDTLGDFEANLSNFGGSISTQSSLVNGLIQKSETYNAGIFSGTRNMALLFSTFGSVNNVFLQNVGDGAIWTRCNASRQCAFISHRYLPRSRWRSGIQSWSLREHHGSIPRRRHAARS